MNEEQLVIRFGQNISHQVTKARKPPNRSLQTPEPECSQLQEPQNGNDICLPTIQQFFKNDHGNYCVKSPRKLNHELHKKQKEIEKLRKRLKVAKQKSRRLAAKTKSLKAVVKELRKRNFISENCEEQLKQSLSGVQLALMKRILSGKNRRGCKYPAQLQSFALTLQFYSAKAYEFVRKAFNLALPHQAQIRRWYGKIPAQPGFTKPAFDAIKAKVETAAVKGNRVVIALMLDEMSIRKQVTWNGTNYSGYVDLGNGAELDDTAPLAKDALVLMAVCVNGHWKVPCGYFFVDGLSGSERANLVNVCLQRLWDTGARVVSVTFDGPSCHFKMAAELGASFVPASLRPSFPHPIDSQHEVTIFLDVCHMLKLVRNTLAEGGILVDHNNNKISWQYVEALHKLQESEGLRLGNKLKASHIHWRQQKMKVNLAAQTFSSSVADAIEYCANVLKLQQFQGSSATVKFIRDTTSKQPDSAAACKAVQPTELRPSISQPHSTSVCTTLGLPSRQAWCSRVKPSLLR
eukprot:gene7827-13692_t